MADIDTLREFTGTASYSIPVVEFRDAIAMKIRELFPVADTQEAAPQNNSDEARLMNETQDEAPLDNKTEAEAQKSTAQSDEVQRIKQVCLDLQEQTLDIVQNLETVMRVQDKLIKSNNSLVGRYDRLESEVKLAQVQIMEKSFSLKRKRGVRVEDKASMMKGYAKLLRGDANAAADVMVQMADDLSAKSARPKITRKRSKNEARDLVERDENDGSQHTDAAGREWT
eukprot:500510-Hanusia_phi.AAC.2